MTSQVTVAEEADELRSAAEKLSRFIDDAASRMAKSVGFSWVAKPTAPNTYSKLRMAYEASRQTRSPLPVSSLYCDSLIYARRQDNYKLRFWHDTLHVQTGLSFSAADELELGLHHIHIAEQEGVVKGSLAWRLLRVDLVGQNYLVAVSGLFPIDQRTFVQRCIRYGLDEGIAMEIAIHKKPAADGHYRDGRSLWPASVPIS